MTELNGSPSVQTSLRGNLFVPSLEYRVKGRSSYWEDVKVLKHYCDEPIQPLVWEWFHSNTTTTTSSLSTTTSTKKQAKGTCSKRLLIGLYAGFDSYAEFLTESARIAKLYATLWQNVTVVTLQGTAFAPHGCQPPGIHTTLNKIRLLFHAIDRGSDDDSEEKSFDQVLLLDADTLLSNMQVDITTLLPKKRQLLAAQPIRMTTTKTTTHHNHQNESSSNKEQPSDVAFRPINAGVTLWNLHHPQIQSVALAWLDGAKEALLANNYHGDQKYLNAALEQEHSKVHYLHTEFAYNHGTVVQHFLRHSSENLQERIQMLKRAAEKVCAEHDDVCLGIPPKRYPTE
jgi:hypothetical protein